MHLDIEKNDRPATLYSIVAETKTFTFIASNDVHSDAHIADENSGLIACLYDVCAFFGKGGLGEEYQILFLHTEYDPSEDEWVITVTTMKKLFK